MPLQILQTAALAFLILLLNRPVSAFRLGRLSQNVQAVVQQSDSAEPVPSVSNVDSSPFQHRLKKLREKMIKANVTTFIIPTYDHHMTELTGQPDMRLAYISGFTGDSGMGLVTRDSAFLVVDSRFPTQAKEQAPRWEVKESSNYGTALAQLIQGNEKVGFNPLLLSRKHYQEIQTTLSEDASTIQLVTVNSLIDQVKIELPENVGALGKVTLFDLPRTFSKNTRQQKLIAARSDMKKVQGKPDALFISSLEDIFWVLNIRGIGHNDRFQMPVTFAYALVTADDVTLFINGADVDTQSLSLKDITIEDYLSTEEEMVSSLKAVKAQTCKDCTSVLVNPEFVNVGAYKALEGLFGTVTESESIFTGPRAVKSTAEIVGMYKANILDGLAIAKFFARKMTQEASERTWTCELDKIKREMPGAQGNSFPTIVAANGHAAMIHFNALQLGAGGSCGATTGKGDETLKIEPGSLVLVDSGLQYYDNSTGPYRGMGTTDMSRTVLIPGGNPPAFLDDVKVHFTAVLKGIIDVTCSVADVTSGTLDTVARKALTDLQKDYSHGTGHGIGAFLNVHEGGTGIGVSMSTDIQVGHIMSVEPGYYEVDKYGIRLENDIAFIDGSMSTELDEVIHSGDGEQTAPCGTASGSRPHFRTLTLVPIDRQLLNFPDLKPAHIAWVNRYHTTVRKALLGALEEDTEDAGKEATKRWIEAETAPLKTKHTPGTTGDAIDKVIDRGDGSAAVEGEDKVIDRGDGLTAVEGE